VTQKLYVPMAQDLSDVLGITAVLSVAGPAWRAARIDPAAALRNI